MNQKKTGRPVQFEITEQTRSAIGEWLAALGARTGSYLFPSRFREQPHLSTRQYARIVHRWAGRAGLELFLPLLRQSPTAARPSQVGGKRSFPTGGAR